MLVKTFLTGKHTKMKINRFDDFTKLREIVLGDVNYSPLSLIKDQNDRDFMRHVLDETKSSLTNLEQILISRYGDQKCSSIQKKPTLELLMQK